MSLNKIIYFTLLLFFCSASEKGSAQNNAAAIAHADTTGFSCNGNGGWQLYNSYVAAKGADSVQVEIILQHSNNIALTMEQYVGKIKLSALRPAAERTAFFYITGNRYYLRVNNDGKCYLRFMSGALPGGEPLILPVKITYKK